MAKKAKKVDAVPTSLLVSRLSRADLESLIVGQVDFGVQISRAAVLELLPEHRRTNSRCVVAENARVREGTGYFDQLSEEQHLAIFLELKFLWRVRVANLVCKSWRAESKNWQDLWKSVAYTREYYSKYNTTNGLSCADLVKGLASLPCPGLVERLQVTLPKQMASANDFKALLKACPLLTELQLASEKVTPEVMKAVAKLGQLESFCLSGYDSKVTSEAVLAVAKACPKLRKLVVNGKWLTANFLRSLSLETRGGGMSLLTHLSATRTLGTFADWGAQVTPETLMGLGQYLPEVQEFNAEMCPYHSIEEDAWKTAVACPRLARVHLNRLCAQDTYGSSLDASYWTTAQLASCIKLVLSIAPKLVDLKIVHGRRRAEQINNLLPTLNGLLVAHPLPCTLESLELGHILVAATDFVGLDLPNLHTMSLTTPSEEERVELMAVLRQNCPALRSLKVTITPNSPATPASAPVAAPAHAPAPAVAPALHLVL